MQPQVTLGQTPGPGAIPAGVFEEMRQEKEDDHSEDGHETDHRSSVGPETGRSKQRSPHRVSHSGTESRPMPRLRHKAVRTLLLQGLIHANE